MNNLCNPCPADAQLRTVFQDHATANTVESRLNDFFILIPDLLYKNDLTYLSDFIFLLEKLRYV